MPEYNEFTPIKLTEEEIAELESFDGSTDIIKDLMDYLFDRMHEFKQKNTHLQRTFWQKIEKKYGIDLKKYHYQANALRGEISMRKRKVEKED